MVKLGLLQLDVQWEDVQANMRRVEGLLEGVSSGELDVLILPELWSCGFTMNHQAHETFAQGLAFMQALSKRLSAAVIGGLPFKAEAGQENRCYLVEGNQYRHYTKIKTFKHLGEHHKYESGKSVCSWNLVGFRWSPFVCYDLRFPELARQTAPQATLLSYIASWPKTRVHHWRQLLQARAIENLCYVVGVNRVGRDGAGLDYVGSSMVVAPNGDVVLDAGEEEGLYRALVSPEVVAEYRDAFRFLDDM